MATTTVRKGAHRATAQAKQAKHAQRTPLPGDGASAPDNLDSMSLPELKQFARANGWSTLVDRGTKPQIIRVLREHPNGPPANAKVAARVATENTKPKKSNSKEVSKVDNAESDLEQLARRIETARGNGFSREDVARAVDDPRITPGKVWRVERRSFVRPHEVPLLAAGLDKIEAGQVEPTRRGRPRSNTESGGRPGTRAALQSKLDEVHQALSEVPVDSKKVTEYRAAIDKALDIIDGNADAESA